LRSRVTITSTAVEVRGHVTLGNEPKTSRSKRTVPVARSVMRRLEKHLAKGVGLSGLEPLTSALSGRFRPPEHARKRQRVAVNSRSDKAQRRSSGTRCHSTSGTGLRRRESRTRPRVDHDARRWRGLIIPWPHVRLGRSEDHLLARRHILNRRGCGRRIGYMPLALAETSNP
jgi:hypothetical protein